MIPGAKPGKHARTSHKGVPGVLEVRDYPDNVCPGRRCAGRVSVHVHQSGMVPAHYLTPEQIAAVTKGAARVLRQFR